MSSDENAHLKKSGSWDPWHPLHVPAKLPQNELRRVQALLAEGILDTSPDAELDGFCEIGRRALNASICAINFIDSDRQWSKARCGLQSQEVHRDISICSHTILLADQSWPPNSRAVPTDSLVVLDTALDERFVYSGIVPHVRFYAGHPLCVYRWGERLAIGTFCVMDSQPRNEFPRADEEKLGVLAGAIIAYIQTTSRPTAHGPLAAPCQEGALLQRMNLLRRCIAVKARAVADSALKILAEILRPRIYQAGHFITKKGEPGDSIFFITCGVVAVRVEGKTLETHGPLQSFGEVALIDLINLRNSGVTEEEARRSCLRGADVEALERCELLELCYSDVAEVIRAAPNLWFTLQDFARARSLRQRRHSGSPTRDLRKDAQEAAGEGGKQGALPESKLPKSKSLSPIRDACSDSTQRPDRSFPSSSFSFSVLKPAS